MTKIEALIAALLLGLDDLLLRLDDVRQLLREVGVVAELLFVLVDAEHFSDHLLDRHPRGIDIR